MVMSVEDYVDIRSVNVKGESPPTVGIISAITAYVLLFIVGLVGNVSVLVGVRSMSKLGLLKINSTIIYLVALCFVDMAFLSTIPLTITDKWIGSWVFGVAVCKANMFFEAIGKILNAYLITALAFDRFVGIRWKFDRKVRSVNFSLVYILVCSIWASLLLTPIVIFATEKETKRRLLLEGREIKGAMAVVERVILLLKNGTLNRKPILEMQFVKTCHIVLPVSLGRYHMVLLFVAGFFVPFVSISYFYGHLAYLLSRMRQSRLPIKRIVLSSAAIAGFYFVCFSPYWLMTLVQQLLKPSSTIRRHHRLFTYAMLAVHWLPPLNSALNWVFYGLMNRQLQRCFSIMTSNQQQQQTVVAGATNNKQAEHVCPTDEEDDESYRKRAASLPERKTAFISSLLPRNRSRPCMASCFELKENLTVKRRLLDNDKPPADL